MISHDHAKPGVRRFSCTRGTAVHTASVREGTDSLRPSDNVPEALAPSVLLPAALRASG